MTSDATDHPVKRRQYVVVTALGLGQIFAWGSSYYLLGVLAGPIARDTGWSREWIIGALSLGMLVSGAISPAIGRLIDRIGGRPVLASSAVLLGLGQILLAAAPSLPLFVVAWLVIGLGMGSGLYDPAFATLGRAYGERARSAITHVTLFGGFASTICWPLCALFNDHLGWRGAGLSFAAINLAVVLPLYLIGLPRGHEHAARADHSSADPVPAMRHRAAFVLLAAGFTIASTIMTVIAIQILPLLQARGLTLAAAVGLGALLGPSQVGARVLEAAFGRQHHPVWSLLASAVLVAIGLVLLLGPSTIIGVGLVLYGSGSGIRSIARGTVPLALFGRSGYATLMGKLAMPVLFAQAAAPSIGNVLLERLGATGTVAILVAAAVVNIALVVPLLTFARARAAPASP